MIGRRLLGGPYRESRAICREFEWSNPRSAKRACKFNVLLTTCAARALPLMQTLSPVVSELALVLRKQRACGSFRVRWLLKRAFDFEGCLRLLSAGGGGGGGAATSWC